MNDNTDNSSAYIGRKCKYYIVLSLFIRKIAPKPIAKDTDLWYTFEVHIFSAEIKYFVYPAMYFCFFSVNKSAERAKNRNVTYKNCFSLG